MILSSESDQRNLQVNLFSLTPGVQNCFTQKYIPLSHYPEYPGPTSKKHTTFTIQGRDIPDSVKRGLYQILITKLFYSEGYFNKLE